MAKAKKPQTIYRTASGQNPYAQIVRTMLQDDELSLEAAGTLVFVLSLHSDWEFDLEWLCKRRKIGRDKAQRIVRELIARGYCVRDQPRGERGRHAPMVYLFSDDPKAISPQPENPVAVTQDVVGPQPGFPAPDEPCAVLPAPDEPRPVNPKQTYKRSNKLDNSTNPPYPQGANDELNFDLGGEAKNDAPPKRKRQSMKVSKEAGVLYRPDATVRDEARRIARGWELDGPDGLVAEFNGMNEGNQLHDADAAFIGFCRKRGPMRDGDGYVLKPTGQSVPEHLQPRDGEIAIPKSSVSWDRWLIYLESVDKPAANLMRKGFVIFAPTPDPLPGSPTPRIPVASVPGNDPRGKAA